MPFAPINAEGVFLEETFNGTGEFEVAGGLIQGLDLPDWMIGLIGSELGELVDGGYGTGRLQGADFPPAVAR